ncbi:MAG: phospholipid carrier-dependent glycosyltransferase [Candidatus Omnitrophica bacterium]|nr:phospholipid carrier-dependent glycosyltransferase [Candidatus Omnitrophota bacterium]
MRGSKFILILIAVMLFLYFFGLGDMPLTDPDETFYAQTAKEMLEADEWVTPMIFGKPQFEKPVLYYLLIVLSYMVFGVGEFAARFPSAVFGILGVLGVYFFGRLLFSPLCGFLSGMVMATCVQYLVLARGCVTDMVLLVFILYTLLFFLMGWMGKGRGYFYLASVAAALAVLTKGPIGLFLPGLTVLLFILLTRQWKRFPEIPLLRCILLLLLVSLPWYIAVYRMHGSAFVDEFFGFHNVTRFLVPEHRIGTSPYFYIPVILGGFFPWSTFLLFGAWNMWRHPHPGSADSRAGNYRLFLLLWFLVVFLFFSSSSTKLVTYIFPLFPVLALVAGRFWERFITSSDEDERTSFFMKISFWILVGSSPVAAAGAVFLVRYEYATTSAVQGTIMASVLYLLAIIVSALFFLKRRRMASFGAIASSVLVCALPVVWFILPVVGVHESSKELSLKVRELASSDEAVGGECDHRRGIAFYSGRTDMTDIHPHQALRDFFSRKERVWGIIQQKHYRNLKAEMPGKVSEPVASSGEYVLITNE